jgi:hypothetical protein
MVMIKTKSKLIRLDVACGNNKTKGFIGIDIVGKPKSQADIVHDLSIYPWPFKDNLIDEVYCSHYLEHVPHIDSYNDGLFNFMNELYRIIKKNALAKFVCPYYTSIRAIQDPTHHRSIGEATFLYFNENWRKINKLEHYPITCNFEAIKMDHSVSEEFVGRSQEAITYEALHSWNVVSDIVVTLKKI